jgi:hypothetical protein
VVAPGNEENNAPLAKKVMIKNPYDSAEENGTIMPKKSSIPT